MHVAGRCAYVRPSFNQPIPPAGLRKVCDKMSHKASTPPLRKKRKFWFVGEHVASSFVPAPGEPPPWEYRGLYGTKHEAKRACLKLCPPLEREYNNRYFIAPVVLGMDYKIGAEPWHGAEYPKRGNDNPPADERPCGHRPAQHHHEGLRKIALRSDIYTNNPPTITPELLKEMRRLLCRGSATSAGATRSKVRQ